MSRIEPRVLHNDRHIGLEHRRKVGIPRHRGRFFKVVETKMQRAPRRNGHPVGADRLAAGEKERDVDMRLLVARIENARRLVRNERLVRKRALRGNVTFGDGPAPAPDGLHITFYIASGEIHGPKINARIRGEGGDWMLVRRDGVGVADVRITYETDDGALLLSRYYGIFDLGPDGYERALRNDYEPLPPLVLAPQFVTSHPDWLWLNRVQCIAVGRVTMADLLVRFDLYAIRVGQPLPSSGLPRAPDGAGGTA